MKQLLLDIVNSIVDKPEKVRLEESADEEGNINFTLTVDPEDMGKIIGKEGKVIKSIRNIIRIPAIKQNKRVNLELTEQERIVKEEALEEGGVAKEEKPSKTEVKIDEAKTEELVEEQEKGGELKPAEEEEPEKTEELTK